MEKWVLIVRSNCADDLREGEFLDWYDNVHIPDLMTIPQFVRAVRCVNPDMSTKETGKFVAVYDIETEDIQDVITAMYDNRVKWTEQGRMTDLLVPLSMTFYRQEKFSSK